MPSFSHCNLAHIGVCREREEEEEAEEDFLTIKKSLKVGVYNALSGNTASGRTGSSMWRRVLYPKHSVGEEESGCKWASLSVQQVKVGKGNALSGNERVDMCERKGWLV